ncbi:MAG TPA: TatD family hydrolase [Flavobacteriaceae bacterium]|nr:TatD family hydrolase [Flavobacteriaceae bacterium]
MIIDTHTHLYSQAFSEDRDLMMERAFAAGIEKFVVPAIDSSYASDMYDLEKKYPENVYLMMGLHPTSVKQESFIEELDFVEKQFEQKNFCAVGEIGIDLYWDKSTLSIQQEAFRRQIRLAKRNNLPIVIHCRDAFDEVFEVLEKEKDDKLFGIFHCFTGNLEEAQRAISLKMKLGIGGVVTFKNGKIDTFLREISINHIVMETDSPYLAPAPFRGKRNESSYITFVQKKLAEIYKISEEEVAQITTKNAREIFNI